MPKVPDRWLDYTKLGRTVAGTFVAFKTPLDRNPNLEFTVDDVLRKIPDLGLIIDLTNTFRYYDGNSFTKRNVDYLKLKCPGRVIPPDDVYDRFRYAVKKFVRNKDNDGLIIGVHCTHGINRTGYFISKYLIEEKGYDARVAIDYVGKCRGHSIEREEYTKELMLLSR